MVGIGKRWRRIDEMLYRHWEDSFGRPQISSKILPWKEKVSDDWVFRWGTLKTTRDNIIVWSLSCLLGVLATGFPYYWDREIHIALIGGRGLQVLFIKAWLQPISMSCLVAHYRVYLPDFFDQFTATEFTAIDLKFDNLLNLISP